MESEASLPSLLLADGCYFPAAFQHPLRIAHRLSNSLWAYLRGFSIPFQQCPAAV
jgi:hypothetical protein